MVASLIKIEVKPNINRPIVLKDRKVSGSSMRWVVFPQRLERLVVRTQAEKKEVNILLVEPAGGRRDLLNRLFSNFAPNQSNEYSYQVNKIDSCREAFPLFKKNHPDIVLVDLRLGADVCKDLCREIRSFESHRHTGVIFFNLDTSDSNSLAVEFLEAGADDVINTTCSDREATARVCAVLKLKVMTDELRSANHKLHQLSYTDDLTGLNNMRAFNAKYSEAIKKCFSGETGLGVIMLDLDHFKNVNDQSNHLMGSHVIGEVGRIISSMGVLTADDCAARFGGDEYVIFTLDKKLINVTRKAEKIRKAINNGIFVKDGFSMRITTSVGVSWTAPNYGGKEEDSIKAADIMLYVSKGNGRDQVNSVALRDPVDLDHICRTHLVERDACGDDNDFARIYNF